MTVSVTPWAIDGKTHPAAEVRAALCAQLGGTPGVFVTAVSATDGAHGIAGATDLKVTQNGTPNMSVNVAAGAAFVRSGETAGQAYAARNDGTVNLSIAAADATNARRDLIVLQVRDSNFSGADDDARLFVVQGTPAASPVDPSLAATPNALVLARIQVNAVDTSIVTGDITDVRVGAHGSAWFQPRGHMASVTKATSATGYSSTVADIPSLTATWTADANRRYRTRITIPILTQSSAAGLATLYMTTSANVQLTASQVSMVSATHVAQASLDLPETGLSGSTTRKARLSVSAGNVEATASATVLMTLVVEDMGGLVV